MRWAPLVVVALCAPALAGCLDLKLARVPDKLLEGSGGNGWAKNASASQKEPASAQAGTTKVQTLVYDDRQSSQGYPGTVSVTTLRTLVNPSEEKIRDDVQARIKSAAQAKGIQVQGSPQQGTRPLANGAEALWFVHNGSVETAGFFARSAQVKLFGEVWRCPDAREVVVTVGLAQTTDVTTIGGILTQTNPDDTTWREIVADPRGRVEGYRGSSGLAYNVEC